MQWLILVPILLAGALILYERRKGVAAKVVEVAQSVADPGEVVTSGVDTLDGSTGVQQDDPVLDVRYPSVGTSAAWKAGEWVSPRTGNLYIASPAGWELVKE